MKHPCFPFLYGSGNDPRYQETITIVDVPFVGHSQKEAWSLFLLLLFSSSGFLFSQTLSTKGLQGKSCKKDAAGKDEDFSHGLTKNDELFSLW